MADYELANTTGQIGAIVEMLTAHYPNAGQFSITLAPLFDSSYVYGEPETNDPDLWLTGDGENEDSIFLNGDDESSTIQFIVYAPSLLQNSPNDIAVITELVQQTCFSGLAFTIQFQ
jgi:hypothetical protein